MNNLKQLLSMKAIFCFFLTTHLLAIMPLPNDFIAERIFEEKKLIDIIRAMTIEFENFDVIQTYINENVGRIHDPENIRSALSNKFFQLFPNSFNDYLRRIEYPGHRESVLLSTFSVVLGMFSGMFYLEKHYSYARNCALTSAGFFLLLIGFVQSKKSSWAKQKKLLNLMRSF